MGNKKICFVTTVSMTLKAFVLDTAKYLHENGGYEITFLCAPDDQFGEMLPSYIRYIPVSMKRGISLGGLGAFFQIYRIMKKYRFDLVQYSTPNASLYTSLASALAGIPVRLYCQWGIVYVRFSGFKRWIFKTIEKLVCALSTHIEPDSFGNLRFGREEKLYSEKKSSVVWNGSAAGVNLKKFTVSNKEQYRREIREKYNIGENDFVMGFVGRVTRDKGMNELFYATQCFFEERQDAFLLLIGDNENPESVEKELYKWSLDCPRIIYCGRTNEVEKYLSALDVFILPSYREGFGSVLVEAEAMGVPVITTDIPGPTDAMVPEQTGLLVKVKDRVSLLEAIRCMASQSEVCEEMAKQAYRFAAERFDSEKLLLKILEDRKMLLGE